MIFDVIKEYKHWTLYRPNLAEHITSRGMYYLRKKYIKSDSNNTLGLSKYKSQPAVFHLERMCVDPTNMTELEMALLEIEYGVDFTPLDKGGRVNAV